MQLSLFQPVVFDSAERLLEMLNDGLKKPFVSQFYFEEKGLFVFMAADDYPGIVCAGRRHAGRNGGSFVNRNENSTGPGQR